MTNQVLLYCRNCGKNTLHLQPSTSHVLHLLLSICTFGLWLIVWVLLAHNNQEVCSICGTKQGLFGDFGKEKFHRPDPLQVHCPDCKELVLADAIDEAHQSDAQEVEPLRAVAYNDIALEFNRPDGAIPLTATQKILAALA